MLSFFVDTRIAFIGFRENTGKPWVSLFYRFRRKSSKGNDICVKKHAKLKREVITSIYYMQRRIFLFK